MRRLRFLLLGVLVCLPLLPLATPSGEPAKAPAPKTGVRDLSEFGPVAA